MTINQLFTKKPSKELVDTIIKAFGLKGFNDENNPPTCFISFLVSFLFINPPNKFLKENIFSLFI